MLAALVAALAPVSQGEVRGPPTVPQQLKMTEYAKVCLHPGVEVGSNETGPDIEIINDLVDIRNFEVEDLLHYHVSSLKVCEAKSALSGIEVTLTDHKNFYKAGEKVDDRPITLKRIGDINNNCRTFDVAENTFIQSIRVKSDSEMIRQMFIEGSDGAYAVFGTKPEDEANYNHTLYEFADGHRLTGVYGRQVK